MHPEDDDAATPPTRPWSRSPLNAVALVLMLGVLAPVVGVGLLALLAWAFGRP